MASEIEILVPAGEINVVMNPTLEGDMVDLTDVWRKFGSVDAKKPAEWKRTKEAKDFLAELAKTLAVGESHFWKVIKGKNARTLCSVKVFLAYLSWVSPAAKIKMIDIVIEKAEETANPELGVTRASQRYRKYLKSLGHSDDWIDKRLKGTQQRTGMTSELASRGIGRTRETQWEYGAITNTTYRGVFGADKNGLLKRKGLPMKASLRDNMSSQELDAVEFAEGGLLTSVRNKDLYGYKQINQEAARVGAIVAEAVRQITQN